MEDILTDIRQELNRNNAQRVQQSQRVHKYNKNMQNLRNHKEKDIIFTIKGNSNALGIFV